MKVNLIYGTETGFTKRVGEQILRTLAVSNYWCSMKSLSQVEEKDWTDCDLTIIGAPTWCEPRLDEYGQYSDDWNDYYETFRDIDFTGQRVALYGLGDQIGYGHNFVDALGMMAEVVLKNGGTLYGKVSQDGYEYPESKGIDEDGLFYGLPIDEDNESNLTVQRVNDWISQLKEEIKWNPDDTIKDA